MAHKISSEVESILRKSACYNEYLALPPGQLDRKMYEAVNKVLEISGFKWDRKSKRHLATSGTAAETLAKALGDGEIVDPKKEFDFFQTPENLALRMAGMLRVEPHHTVLEPSAGGGRLCRAVLDYYIAEKNRISFFEIQDVLRDKLIALGFRFVGIDFEKYGPDSIGYERFDRVVGNPPFSNAQDLAHFRKMYDCLKPRGRMVCITGTSWQWRTQKKFVEFKNWFESLPHTQVEELPAGTFKDSGTNVPALLITVDKE